MNRDSINLLDEVRNMSFPSPILSFTDMMQQFKQDQKQKKTDKDNPPIMLSEPKIIHKSSFLKRDHSSHALLQPSPRLELERKSSLWLTHHENFGLQAHVRQNTRQSISRSSNGDMKINQYLIKELIGRGAFAEVKLCEDTLTGQTFAVKILEEHKLKKKMFSKDPNNKADQVIRSEIAILKKISHPNIVKLIEIIDDEEYKRVYLIMEYCAKGSINRPSVNDSFPLSLSTEPQTLNEKQAKVQMKSLLLALDYLHNKVGIAHRDIKPENLLLSADDVLKLTDFGLSTEDSQSNNKSGTRVYMAPQTYTEKVFDLKGCDVWSLGITLLVLLTGRLPYPEDVTDFELAEAIQKKTFDFSLEVMSENLKNFLHQCLQKDPKKRSTIATLMKHPWVTDGGKEPLVNVTVQIDFEVTENQKQNALQPRQGKAPGARRKNYKLNEDIV